MQCKEACLGGVALHEEDHARILHQSRRQHHQDHRRQTCDRARSGPAETRASLIHDVERCDPRATWLKIECTSAQSIHKPRNVASVKVLLPTGGGEIVKIIGPIDFAGACREREVRVSVRDRCGLLVVELCSYSLSSFKKSLSDTFWFFLGAAERRE